jgi:hypothetical protein
MAEMDESREPKMTRRQTSSSPEDVRKTLKEILDGTKTEENQLERFARAAHAEIALPADAFVIGEPVKVMAIEYDGNVRRGLSANVRRGDECYDVNLGDVVFSPGTEESLFSAVYRAWLGLETRGGSKPSRLRPHKVEASDLRLGGPIDLIVLACKSNAIRCRVPGTQRELTLRTAVRDEVPAEIITVIPAKQWTHAGHPYVSGKVQKSLFDAAALDLVPLALRPEGDWDPEDEYWGEEGEPLPDWAKPIVARGKRPAFEMEQIIPGQDPEDFDTDPIVEAAEMKNAGARGEAEDLLTGLLARDLRCLDAHAHLGNFEFPHQPKQALRHYAVGVGIGELTLGANFDGVLPWGLIDNRPFLRCLHGLGISSWRVGDRGRATAIFRRMLWLNPSDNQGARFNLAAVEAGRTWEEETEGADA